LKPKLLITASTLPNYERDPEPRFVIDLAIGLSRHFEVCILAPRNPGATAIDAFRNIEVRRYPYAPVRRWEQLTYPGAMLERLYQVPSRWALVPLLLGALYRETRRVLTERNFACVHTHWLVPQGVMQSLTSSGKSQTPYIAIAHGADVHAMNGIFASAMLRRAVAGASGVVGVSHQLIATLRRRFPSEMAARPAIVIGCGVDTEKFSPALRSDDWPAVHGMSRPMIVYVGRLSEKKGIEFLLAAMASEPLLALRASLLILGRGPLEERLKSISKTLELGNRVRFVPPCDHSILGHYIAAGDVLCLPSIVTARGDQEGRPTVLVEAAACGIPAVASDVGGVREWIDDGRNGLVVPQADPLALAHALAGLLRQPERIRRMGQEARKKALETSWSAVADRYAEFTFKVIDRVPLQQ
jgi:glycosyltransferase involved in cell wall biosynthesis